MATDAFVFDCELRKRAGTGGSRAVRRDGWVPAVLYGGDQEPANIKLRYNQVLKAYQTGRLIDVLSKISVDGKEQQVIGRDIQVDPVKDLPMHVDLMRVDSKTRLTVNVPMHFLNQDKCPGLDKGGVLNIVRHEVEVKASATAIPEALECDLSSADVGDAIHISSVKLPDGVELTVTDRDFTIATIAAPSAMRSAGSDEDTPDADEVEAINVDE
ncbi:50S ribosomal protein L25/general stress protein Ctc [Parvularcula sp. LCG005]|uniref:50S ribosomal protein L25/general stress protein Ctc n=1 Tax=Parvularcula sp. LCG005 TaxID=3078805 RepID=UPI002941FC7F|nr:50S ribosomal protein L25/general stress protein Ctc [Parvularcula sp. LCG005]WOI54439.1 50S ribosomal protein L25/general stress protein Ctc [Parvularcula sp. LCG005]